MILFNGSGECQASLSDLWRRCWYFQLDPNLQDLRGNLRQLLAEGEQLPLDDVQMEACVCGLIRRHASNDD